MNLLVAAGPQVLDAAWASRLKVARRDIGEGMTMAKVDQLCETIDLRALPAYWAAVGERPAAVVSALTPGALDRVISPKELEWASSTRGCFPARWSHVPKSCGRIYLPFIHNEHIGQADLLRGLLGRPGAF